MNALRPAALASLFLLSAVAAHASEKTIKLSAAPAPVQKTIKEKSQGAKLKRIVVDTSNGGVAYEAEMTVAGRSKDVTIDAAGNILEVEETVTLDSLPTHARLAVENAAEGGKIKSLESVSHGGAVEVYEATIKKAGKKFEFKVDPTGKPLP